MTDPSTLTSKIEAVEKLRGHRVIVIAASWRDDMTHDLGAEAARAFMDVFDALGTERPEQVSLFLVVRGGLVGFADQVIRTLRGTGTTAEVIVPTFCNGVASMLALAGGKVVLHPHGGLGAYDAGPVTATSARLDHDLVDFVPALGGIHYQSVDDHLPARLAMGIRQRKLCRELGYRIGAPDEAISALSHAQLGTSTGLGAADLRDVGLEVELVDDAAIWNLYRAVEDVLELRATPPLPYTQSDLGDEAEFTPAVGFTSALIESTASSVGYRIDTGRPHPETGEYVGHWSW